MKEVLVIGGGAAGLFSALLLAEGGAKVTVLEALKAPVKKLSLTGNGKCNITNLDFENFKRIYHEKGSFAENIIKKFDNKALMTYLEANLLPITVKRDNYVYPLSESAANFSFLLREMALERGVKLKCNANVKSIEKSGDKFTVYTDDWHYEGDYVVMATGSKAGPVKEMEEINDGLAVVEKLGHSILPLYPALTGLITDDKTVLKAAGIRTEGRAELFIDSKKVYSDKGEIQFNNKGLSGIPIMQMSRYVSKALLYNKNSDIEILLDLLPSKESEELTEYIMKSAENHGKIFLSHFLKAFFHEKLVQCILERRGLKGTEELSLLNKEKAKALTEEIKAFKVKIKGSGDFRSAQVAGGGLSLSEVDKDSLQSLKLKGLYFCGEILDIDGICGGYNLQWAFSSGAVVASNILK